SALERANQAQELVKDVPTLLPEWVDILIWLAELHDASGHASRAMNKVEQARTVLNRTDWPSHITTAKQEVHLLRVEGAIKLRMGKWEEAEECLRNAVKLIWLARGDLGHQEAQWQRAFVYRELARLALRLGKTQYAIKYI